MISKLLALLGTAAIFAAVPIAHAQSGASTNPISTSTAGTATDDGLQSDVFTSLLVDGASTQNNTEVFSQTDLDNSANVYTTTPLTYSAVTALSASSNSLSSLLPSPTNTAGSSGDTGSTSGAHPIAVVIGYSLTEFYFYYAILAVLGLVAAILLLMHSGDLAEFRKRALGFMLISGLVIFVGYLAA